MPRSGRRPGNARTRDHILEAARRRFAEDGYRGATIRGIAADAAVDPALVHHYFGAKRDLFAAVLDIPVSPSFVGEVLAAAPTDELGERILRTFLRVWDQAAHRERLQILLRTAASDEDAARTIREFLVDALLGAVTERLGVEDAGLRATLVASQLIGFAFLRYLLQIEPLASASHERVIAAYAPTVQRYLTGDI